MITSQTNDRIKHVRALQARRNARQKASQFVIEGLRLVNEARLAGVLVDEVFYTDTFAEDDDAWSADQAIIKYLDSDAPVSNLTVSSDGGGCLPVFDENGVLTHMDVGDSCELMIALRAVVASGLALENALPFFTSNVADGLRLSRKGRIGPGMDADLVVLDEHNNIDAVMARGHWHVRDGKQEIKGMF